MSKARICLICGQEKSKINRGDGARKADDPIQRGFEDDVEPCEKCRVKYLTKGVLLVEIIEDAVNPDNIPTLTGSVLVIKNSAYKQLFEMSVPPRKIAFTEVGVIERIVNEVKK